MTKLRQFIIPALVCAALPGTAALAQAPDGNGLGYLSAGELERRCTESEAASVSLCFSYIAAVRDTMRAYGIWLGQREFCEPAQLAQSELRNVFLGYLRAYPAARNGQAASAVVVALKEGFPCAQSPAPEPPTSPSTARSSPSANR